MLPDDAVPETLARTSGVHGEVTLRRRPGPVYELIVGGVFLMDSAETSTERLLAETVLARHPDPARILVGGLGLGFTVGALLADRRVQHVHVVEIEPSIVDWLRSGLVPDADRVLADPRVTVSVGDVIVALDAAPPSTYDTILLDVDNGPDFLVHERNSTLYQTDTLGRAVRTLRPGGTIAVWSAAPSAALHAALASAVGPTEEVRSQVVREGRRLTYHFYLATAGVR